MQKHRSRASISSYANRERASESSDTRMMRRKRGCSSIRELGKAQSSLIWSAVESNVLWPARGRIAVVRVSRRVHRESGSLTLGGGQAGGSLASPRLHAGYEWNSCSQHRDPSEWCHISYPGCVCWQTRKKRQNATAPPPPPPPLPTALIPSYTGSASTSIYFFKDTVFASMK